MDLETKNKIKRLENMIIDIYRLIDTLEKRTIQNSYTMPQNRNDFCKHCNDSGGHKF